MIDGKQIEGMVKAMCSKYDLCWQCSFSGDCRVKDYAYRIYNAGYRKQIKGEAVYGKEEKEGER